MNPHDHNVRVLPGPNSWLVQRTDRDQAEAAEAVSSLGAFLNRVLNQASPAGLRGVFQLLHATATGGRFVIGAARPIIVQPHRERPPLPVGLEIDGKSDGSALLRRVRAIQPWFLSVTFEWHGGTTVLPWPQHFAHVLGSENASDIELDWLLLESHKGKRYA
ncbi:MAG: hypothetical protein KGI75_19995 [Rhizobiaceae bacterium]|nr:hypothetical protein [Rhizobiaceae bacterium]